ncbi:hypothetical protein EON63_23625, partial [archaeon]
MKMKAKWYPIERDGVCMLLRTWRSICRHGIMHCFLRRCIDCGDISGKLVTTLVTTHTPYTIHHTPYTIYHIPYTIYHTPYT